MDVVRAQAHGPKRRPASRLALVRRWGETVTRFILAALVLLVAFYATTFVQSLIN